MDAIRNISTFCLLIASQQMPSRGLTAFWRPAANRTHGATIPATLPEQDESQLNVCLYSVSSSQVHGSTRPGG